MVCIFPVLEHRCFDFGGHQSDSPSWKRRAEVNSCSRNAIQGEGPRIGASCFLRVYRSVVLLSPLQQTPVTPIREPGASTRAVSIEMLSPEHLSVIIPSLVRVNIVPRAE